MQKRSFSRQTLGALAVATAFGAAMYVLPYTAAGAGTPAPLAQATAVSVQPTATSPQPVPPKRQVKFFPVDARFQSYYNAHDGLRTMGQAISPLTTTVDNKPAQYFEKARLEDRSSESSNPVFQFQYGLLVDEMKAVRSLAPVGGDQSTVTYDTIQTASADTNRVPPPAGFTGNTATLPDGSVFVPFTADLSPAPGHRVPSYFWEFINRPELFPGGWLHDIGLPITEPMNASVSKGIIIGIQITPVTNRPIVIQAFQRTILTYDPANPAGYLVERANTGTDFETIFPDRVPQ
jgi:hypothetical protein